MIYFSVIDQNNQINSISLHQYESYWYSMILICWANSMIAHKILYYPKYWDTLTPYHTFPVICKSLFHYLLMCPKYCRTSGKQRISWSDAIFCGIWSGSTLFAQTCLSKYLCLDAKTTKSIFYIFPSLKLWLWQRVLAVLRFNRSINNISIRSNYHPAEKGKKNGTL